MKSKQKLIEKWESAIEAAEFYGKGKEDRLIEYMRDFVGDLSQLDEPEVLSQEWIDNNQVINIAPEGVVYCVEVDDLQNLLVPKQEEITESFKETIQELIKTSELAMDVQKLTGMTLEEIKEEARNGGFVPKQELPVIPKYVADWFEENKEHFEDRLKSAIKYREINDDPSEFDAWLDNPRNKPLQTLGNMFNGYGLEERKYNVKFKVKSSFGTVGIFLYKQGDEVLAGDNFDVYDLKEDRFRLTEQEIKDFDPRCWSFAVEVE